MTSDPAFRKGLYRGTAPYYDRYRPPYPAALFDDLRRRLPVSGGGELLDLGCGTGQIAFPLAGHFAEVVAVDQEPESVEFGRARAETAGITNIEWVVGSAETVVLDGPFELIAVGNAFQRLNRPAVAERMRSWLRPGGGVALLWSDVSWRGGQPWQRALEEFVIEWMGRADTTDRIPAGWEDAMRDNPHDQVLRRAGFDYVGKFEFEAEQTWTLESLAGYMYSTSILSRAALGERAEEFERSLADRMLGFSPDGVFRQRAVDAYELARAPEG